MRGAARDRILHIIVFMTMLTLVIDAGGQIGVRALFPIGLLLIVLLKGKFFAFPHGLLLFGLMVAYPTCLYFLGLMRNASAEVAVSQYRSTVFSWAMFIALAGINYAFLARALYSSIAVTAFIATILALGLVLDVPGVASYLGSLTEQAAGYFVMRGIGESFIPNVQFKSTLFFVPAALFFLFRKQFVPFYVCFVGLIAGVSKTGMAFVLVTSVLWFLASKGYKRWLGFSVVTLIVFLLYNSPLWELFLEIEEGESQTVEIRLLHYDSIVKLFSEDHIGFVLGFGLGTEFYSEGAGAFVTNIELDHLNAIRKYGLIWSLVFFGLIISVAWRAISSRVADVRILGVCLAAAFVVAGTNPVLISPIFFLILFVTIQALDQSRIDRASMQASRQLIASMPGSGHIGGSHMLRRASERSIARGC